MAKRSAKSSSSAQAEPALFTSAPKLKANKSDINWTPEQRAGIETVGGGLLVSAAAGSGKTAVLAARCVHLVCDADQKCDVDELLVLTFTKAAAAEMRHRIEARLRDRLGDADDARLAKQIALLDRAQISTIHSFCSVLLRQHFHLLGIDPNFRTLEEEESQLMRLEIARTLFADRYEKDDSGEFQRFIDGYANGEDERLIHQLLRAHDMLASLIDPAKWLANARTRIEEGAAKPLTDSALGHELATLVHEKLANLRTRAVEHIERIHEMHGLDLYVNHLSDLIAILEYWIDEFGESRFDRLAAVRSSLEIPRLPTIRNADPAEKELAQSYINSIKKEMKEGQLAEIGRFSEAEWREGMRRIVEPANVFLGLVEEFSKRYRAAKDEQRAIDFSDLERFALRILSEGDSRKPTSAARRCHAQFKHVLVDEYQDVNEVQNEILHLTSRDCMCAEMSSNLFCVGDVKQSIYRFRLAEPKLFLDRTGAWRIKGSGGQVIDLQANFRSRGPLLHVLNGVFQRLMTKAAAELDYDRTHHLVPGATYPNTNGAAHFSGSPVELHLIPRAPDSQSDTEPENDFDADLDRNEREAAFIAHRIREIMGHLDQPRMNVMGKDDADNPILRPIQYREIVVLLRSMKFKSDQYAELLRAAGVPVHSESGAGFFDSMEVRDMIALLQTLENLQRDIPLAAMLRSPIAALPEPEDCLSRIRLAYPSSTIPFHRAVLRYADEQRDELAARLRDFLSQHARWRDLAHRRPLAELIWTIYDESGYLAFCSGLSGGEQRVANLVRLHEKARQFGSFQRQGLARFMGFLDSLREESDLGTPSIASEAEDVVRIMSVHRSKGLEFPVVFIPDLGRKHNTRDCSGPILADRAGYLGLSVVDEIKRIRYPSLPHALLQNRIRNQTIAEELRVLYVAMTRAREHLILVGTCKEEKPPEWRQRWSDHEGALPADEVIRSSCMLDWIGPVSAAMNGERHRIEMTSHKEEDLPTWTASAAKKQLSKVQQHLADLEPLDPPLKCDATAQSVIDRLTKDYPFEAFTTLAATQSVTSITKHGRAAPGGIAPSFTELVPFDQKLALPKCVTADAKLAPTEIGSLTHAALQHIDFTRSCDAADLKLQIEQLVAKKKLARDCNESLDLTAIEWLMQTDVGKLLCKHAKLLRREVPIYYPIKTIESSDPMDRVMIRGQIDALIPTESGLVLIDYKTDRVTEETIDSRAEFYRGQVESYANAVRSITNQPIIATYLVFLTPRLIRSM